MNKTYRQGDVLLESVTCIPEGAVEIKPTKDGKIILALGEATGHHHRFEDVLEEDPTVKMWAIGKVKYIEVMANVMLKHEEHAPHAIPPGIYKLPVQVQYSPKELQRVTD